MLSMKNYVKMPHQLSSASCPGDKHFHTIPQIIFAGGRHYLKAISHMGDDEPAERV